MPLTEITCNLHMHTPYSDGEWSHAQIAQAACQAGLDVIAVTDHNIWVRGPERYYEQDGRRVLLLVGEEVHDAARQPQKNHLLVYGANCELAQHAPDPQALLDAVRAAGGLAFLAHPDDPAAPVVREAALGWDSWEVSGYTGIELWNYMTVFKTLLTSRSNAIRYATDPEPGIRGPQPQTLARWDALTASGRRVVAIGGADAHGSEYRMGALRRVVFPYPFLFRAVNTHLLLERPLNGQLEHDRRLVLDALARGHGFVAYDGAGPTHGFRFSASGESGAAIMGDEVANRSGLTFQIAAPAPASLRLIRDGQEAARWEPQSHAAHTVPAGQAGVFRVEAHLPFRGGTRGWIYSNPIYVRA